MPEPVEAALLGGDARERRLSELWLRVGTEMTRLKRLQEEAPSADAATEAKRRKIMAENFMQFLKATETAILEPGVAPADVRATSPAPAAPAPAPNAPAPPCPRGQHAIPWPQTLAAGKGLARAMPTSQPRASAASAPSPAAAAPAGAGAQPRTRHRSKGPPETVAGMDTTPVPTQAPASEPADPGPPGTAAAAVPALALSAGTGSDQLLLPSQFRDASEEEVAWMPCIWAAFEGFLSKEEKLKDSTVKVYVTSVRRLFAMDGKAPAEMATDAYLRSIKHTLEDRRSNKQDSSAISKFAAFWPRWVKEPVDTAAEEPASRWPIPARVDRWDPCSGDSSAEAREAMELPDGWFVHHSKGNNRLLGWASPGKRLYFRKDDLDERLGRVPPPRLPKFFDKAHFPFMVDGDVETPEKLPATRFESPTPLEELLAKTNDSEAATLEDRQLLPRVLVTFSRRLEDVLDKRQTTRDQYVLSVFKIFSKSGRSLQALVEPSFVEAVVRSEENKKSHGSYGTALKTFSAFWKQYGGYGATYDVADRSVLNLTLEVRPCLQDTQGECGETGCAGELCRRRKQRCETCGIVIRCSKHGQHSKEECREIFWATHSAGGQRSRTMQDFLRPRRSAAEGAGRAGGDLELLAV